VKIPFDAVIHPDKLGKYLLAFRPKNDKSRFLAQVGFTSTNPFELERALRRLTAEYDAVLDRRNEYGAYYRVEGELIGPRGILAVVTIWLHDEAVDVVRFVTLKPARYSDAA
jgi:hypothetical protein